MIELPTPETDALDRELHNPRVLQDRYSEMMEHAQNMERERDEARESLKHITEYGTEEINAAIDLRQKLASALVERDEAREEIRDWKRLHDAAERGVDLTIAEGTISDLLKQRDEARRECKFLWEERDEAREQYDQICSQTLIEINKVCDERDKLREALREVLKVSESTPVLTYQKMEDIASKALKDTEK